MGKFISGMIIGELNGIALGVAGTVVAIVIAGVASGLEKDEKNRKEPVSFNSYYQNYVNKEADHE